MVIDCLSSNDVLRSSSVQDGQLRGRWPTPFEECGGRRSYLAARTLDQVFPLLSSQPQTSCVCLWERYLVCLPPSSSRCSTRASLLLLLPRSPTFAQPAETPAPLRPVQPCTRPPVNTRPVSKHTSFSGFVQTNLILQIPLVRFKPTRLRKEKSRPANWVFSRHPWLNEPRHIPTVQYSSHTHTHLNSPSILYFKQHDLPFWVTIRTKAKFLHVPLLF